MLSGLWSKSNFIFVGLFLLVGSFASQGAVFQVCLYLVPLCMMIGKEYRHVFFGLLTKYLAYSCSYVVLVCVVSFVIEGVEESLIDYKGLKDIFDMLWRLVLLPFALVTFFVVKEECIKYIPASLFVVFVVYLGFGYFDFFREAVEGYRMTGLVKNANGFGFVSASAALFFMFGVLFKKWDRFYMLCGFLLAFSALLLSGSRGALLAVLFSFFFAYVLVLRNSISFSKKSFVGGVFVVFLCFLILYPYIQDRISNVFHDPIRISIWEYYFSHILEYPIFGRFNIEDYLYYNDEYAMFFGPHNIHLEILSRSGIVGYAVFVCFVLKLFRVVLDSTFESVFCLSLLLLVLFAGFFDFSLYGDTILQIPMALSIAYCVWLLRFRAVQSDSALQTRI